MSVLALRASRIAASLRQTSEPIHLIRFSRTESPEYINGGAGWSELAAHEYCDQIGFVPGRVSKDDEFIRVREVGLERHAHEFKASDAGQPRGVMVVTCAAA